MRLRTCLAVVGLALLLAAARAGAGELSPDPAAKTRQVLATPVDIHFDVKAPPPSLDQFLDLLEKEVPGLRIVVDPVGQEDAEFTREFYQRPPDFATVQTALGSFRQIPVGEALTVCLPRDLTWVPELRGVRILTADQYARDFTIVRYPVRALVEALASGENAGRGKKYAEHPQGDMAMVSGLFGAGGLTSGLFAAPGGAGGGSLFGTPPTYDQQLIDLLQHAVSANVSRRIAPWNGEGGDASILRVSGDLIVRQTPEGQERIAAVLARLGAVLGLEREYADPTRPQVAEALEKTRRLLATPVDLDWEALSLRNFLAVLNELVPGLNLVSSPDLADPPLGDQEMSLSVAAKRIPVEKTLEICLPRDVQFEVMPGWVRVTKSEARPQALTLAVYPVRDLFFTPRASALTPPTPWSMTGPQLGIQELFDIVQKTINSQSDRAVAAWESEGGTAHIDCLGGLLVVIQTEAAHRQVREMLALLRAALTRAWSLPLHPRAAVRGYMGISDQAQLEIEQALDTCMDVDFRGASAGDVIKAVVNREPRLRVVTGSFGAWPGGKLTLKGKAMSCRDILEKLSGGNKVCEVRPGCVMFTDRNEARQPLVMVIYPVADLVAGTIVMGRAELPGGAVPVMGPQELLDLLVRTVNPAGRRRAPVGTVAWDSEGGVAHADYLSGLLLVTQSAHAHEEISAFLRDLRQAPGGAVRVP
jgi:hypothetical protein